MQTVQIVRCPNCGNLAERWLLSHYAGAGGDQVIQTACPSCDYLMVMSLPTGRVIEAYAPGQTCHYHSVSIQPRVLVTTQ